MEKQTFIAALLSFTKPIGYVILPYSCSSENEIFISLKERLTALNINQYPGLSEAESDFFKLSESFSNQAIIMQFSKKNQTPKDFFASLDKKFTDDMIRPYIGRKLSKIIETLLENDVPFYHLRDSSNLYPEDRISIQKESPRASLKFTRSGEGTQYKLSAFHQDEEIILNQPGNIILVNEPCYYLSGNKLYRFSENISGKLLTPFITRDFIHIPKKLEFTYFSTFIRKIANRCDIEAEGFQVNDLQPEPEAILLLELNWQGRLVLILSFQYGDKQVLVNNPQISFTTLLADESGFVFNRFKRSLAWEVEQVSFLKSLNLRQAEATFSLIDSESSLYPAYRLVEWLSENHTTLTDHSFIVRQPENKKYLMEIPVLNISLSTSQDWFDVFGTVVIREFEIPFSKFRNHIIHNLK